MYSRELLVGWSCDRAAAAEAASAHAQAGACRFYQRGQRDDARERAAEAERRAVAAGIDWARLPRPQLGCAVPDRSGRRRIERRVPPAGCAVPRTLGTIIRMSLSRSVSPPLPQGPAMPEGGGVGAMAGGPVPDELSGPAAAQWLASGPSPAYSDSTGSAWFGAPDGSFWHRDAAGRHFALAADGQTMLALADDGFLYEAVGDGTWRTALADGTPLSVGGDGQLISHRPEGTCWLLGDDGLFYMESPSGTLYPVDPVSGDVLTELPMDADGFDVSSSLDGAPGGELGADFDGGWLV